MEILNGLQNRTGLIYIVICMWDWRPLMKSINCTNQIEQQQQCWLTILCQEWRVWSWLRNAWATGLTCKVEGGRFSFVINRDGDRRTGDIQPADGDSLRKKDYGIIRPQWLSLKNHITGMCVQEAIIHKPDGLGVLRRSHWTETVQNPTEQVWNWSSGKGSEPAKKWRMTDGEELFIWE